MKARVRTAFDFRDPGSVVRRAHLSRALARLNGLRTGNILDVGCGGGRHAFLLARSYPAAAITGIDVDAEALAAAERRNTVPSPDRVSFVLRDASDNVPGRDYDLILCIDVMEHIFNDRRFLRNVAAALRDGGAFFLHTPALEQRRYFGVTEDDARYAGGTEFGHVHRGYGADELTDMVSEVGLTVTDAWSTFAAPAAWLSDLDYILARRRLLPLRLVPFFGSLIFGAYEKRRPPKNGRGVAIIARKGASP